MPSRPGHIRGREWNQDHEVGLTLKNRDEKWEEPGDHRGGHDRRPTVDAQAAVNEDGFPAGGGEGDRDPRRSAEIEGQDKKPIIKSPPSPESGVIYGVALNDDLLWYRHTGRKDGSFRWAFDAGKKVGNGWGNFKHVFSGGDGIIYTITDNGDLLWYRHTGREDGSFRWAFDAGKKVGVGWGNFKHVFSE